MASAEQEIFQALTHAGFSAVQAAGVMGNMENESSFNVESAAMDSNGAMAYGLISWNAASYPSASKLVTGNPTKDLADQIQFLLHNTSGTGQGLQGSTAAQVASNWAQFVEVCQGCSPGGSQNTQRQANANAIMAMAQSGNWGSGPGITGSGGTNASTTASSGIIPGMGLPFPFDVPSIIGNLLGGNNSQAGSLATGIGSGITSGIISGFTSITNAFLKKLGIDGWKDLLIRLGLILLGAIILIVGIIQISHNGSGQQISLSTPTSGGGSDSGTEAAPERNAGGGSRKTNGSSGRANSQSTPAESRKVVTRSKGTPPSKGTGTGAASATRKVGKTAAEMAAIS